VEKKRGGGSESRLGKEWDPTVMLANGMLYGGTGLKKEGLYRREMQLLAAGEDGRSAAQGEAGATEAKTKKKKLTGLKRVGKGEQRLADKRFRRLQCSSSQGKGRCSYFVRVQGLKSQGAKKGSLQSSLPG